MHPPTHPFTNPSTHPPTDPFSHPSMDTWVVSASCLLWTVILGKTPCFKGKPPSLAMSRMSPQGPQPWVTCLNPPSLPRQPHLHHCPHLEDSDEHRMNWHLRKTERHSGNSQDWFFSGNIPVFADAMKWRVWDEVLLDEGSPKSNARALIRDRWAETQQEPQLLSLHSRAWDPPLLGM